VLQGDKEAEMELPVSPLCDRKNTMISESQIGFVSSLFSEFVFLNSFFFKFLDAIQVFNSYCVVFIVW